LHCPNCNCKAARDALEAARSRLTTRRLFTLHKSDDDAAENRVHSGNATLRFRARRKVFV